MPDALTAVAALFTIWAQSSILAEKGEFQRFKSEPEQQIYEDRIQERDLEMRLRREEILTAAWERKQRILVEQRF